MDDHEVCFFFSPKTFFDTFDKAITSGEWSCLHGMASGRYPWAQFM